MWESRRQVRVIDIDLGQVVSQHFHDEICECTLYGSTWLEVVGSDLLSNPNLYLNLHLSSHP
jgi:hypothetical protein